MAAAATQFVIGTLTAVCASLVLVLLLWRLTRHFRSVRRPAPPCCDVTDLLAWLLDGFQALTAFVILVLVVGDDDGTCAVAGLLATLGGALTLCLLATRSVVIATGYHVGSRDVDTKANDGRRCSVVHVGIPLIGLLISVVAVCCVLPLAITPPPPTSRPNHTDHHRISCLPFTSRHSRDSRASAAAAWGYSCFLLVGVGWLPVLVAMVTDVYNCVWRNRSLKQPVAGRVVCVSGALRMVAWSLALAVTSAVVFRQTPVSSHGQLGVTLAVSVDLAILLHVLHDALYLLLLHHRQQQQQQQQQLMPPSRLTAVARAQRQLVRLPFHCMSYSTAPVHHPF